MATEVENNVPFEDEMPAPPSQGGDLPPAGNGGESTGPAIDGSIAASIFDDVPKMGEPIPQGTYHFRLESYTEGWGEPGGKSSQEEKDFGKQPYFILFWNCQQEPYVGRNVREFCPWVNPETTKAAAMGNAVARKIVNNRLWKAKAILEAAGMKPAGNFDFKVFLSSSPELKIQVGTTPKKEKGADGQYHVTSEMDNKTIRYISLHRPM